MTASRFLSRLAIGVAASLLAMQAWSAAVLIQPANGKDSQIVNGALADTNLGNNGFVIDNWSGNLRGIGLIEFDLSAYAGMSVSSATFSLFHMFNADPGTTFNVFRITSGWDENTVTFNTAPSFEPVAVASLTIPDVGINLYRDWDVTAVVNGWLGGAYGNFGLWIEEIPVQGSGVAYFASSDNANGNGPRLAMDVPEPASLALVALALMAATGASRAARRR